MLEYLISNSNMIDKFALTVNLQCKLFNNDKIKNHSNIENLLKKLPLYVDLKSFEETLSVHIIFAARNKYVLSKISCSRFCHFYHTCIVVLPTRSHTSQLRKWNHDMRIPA